MMFENRVLRRILDLREVKYQEDGGGGGKRSLTVCNLHEIHDVCNTCSITNVHISEVNLDVATNETRSAGTSAKFPVKHQHLAADCMVLHLPIKMAVPEEKL
jgi:hypothetical protein